MSFIVQVFKFFRDRVFCVYPYGREMCSQCEFVWGVCGNQRTTLSIGLNFIFIWDGVSWLCCDCQDCLSASRFPEGLQACGTGPASRGYWNPNSGSPSAFTTEPSSQPFNVVFRSASLPRASSHTLPQPVFPCPEAALGSFILEPSQAITSI